MVLPLDDRWHQESLNELSATLTPVLLQVKEGKHDAVLRPFSDTGQHAGDLEHSGHTHPIVVEPWCLGSSVPVLQAHKSRNTELQ